jgi:putative acetyltransferase
MIINTESPDQPEVIALLDRLDAYCAALYPAESNHLMDVASLLQGDVLFLVARDVDGSAVGCAALVRRDGDGGGDAGDGDGQYGELKRMFVDDRKRGQGVGYRLLEHIVMFAAMSGLRTIRLETGIHQPEAIALYERFGFVRCDPFGEYRPDPLSLFMEKNL